MYIIVILKELRYLYRVIKKNRYKKRKAREILVI